MSHTSIFELGVAGTFLCVAMETLQSSKRPRSPDTHVSSVMDDGQPLEETPEYPKTKKSKSKGPSGPLFTLKKWNAVAMWSWDVECDTCAICRVQVMGK